MILMRILVKNRDGDTDGYVESDANILAEIPSQKNRKKLGTKAADRRSWMAPEISGGESAKGDTWSLGIALEELALRQVLPHTQSPRQQTQPLPQSQAPPQSLSPSQSLQKSKYSDDFRDFLTKCFVLNPVDRQSATDLLKHPFVSGCTFSSSVEILKNIQNDISSIPTTGLELSVNSLPTTTAVTPAKVPAVTPPPPPLQLGVDVSTFSTDEELIRGMIHTHLEKEMTNFTNKIVRPLKQQNIALHTVLQAVVKQNTTLLDEVTKLKEEIRELRKKKE